MSGSNFDELQHIRNVVTSFFSPSEGEEQRRTFPHFVHNVCFVVGLVVSILYIAKTFSFLWTQVLSPRFFNSSSVSAYHFRARYGRRSFAVVTAGSDGIGRAFCLELARLGFRVIVISRSVSKLESVCREINQEAGQDRTGFYVPFDFSTAEENDYEELFTKIDAIMESEKITAMMSSPTNLTSSAPQRGGGGEGGAAADSSSSFADALTGNQLLSSYQEQVALGSDAVSILVNNVGINYDHWSDFITHDDRENCKLLKVNCEAQIRMTHHFYQRFMNRIHRCSFSCGIVDLASVSGYCPIPLGGVYAGTKAFNGHFNRSLALEHEGEVKANDIRVWARGHIDFVSVWPGFVATGMTHTDKPTWQIATPASVATQALQQMILVQGRATTPGAVAHFPLAAALEIAPSFLLEWIVLRQNRECEKMGWVAPGIHDRSPLVAVVAKPTLPPKQEQHEQDENKQT